VDVTNNSWFRLSNRFLEDADFFDFTSDEKLCWIYILSLASQKNTGTLMINFKHAEKICSLKPNVLESAIKKLSEINIITIDVTPTLRERNADVTSTCATDITNRHNKQDITNITEHAKSDLPTIANYFDFNLSSTKTVQIKKELMQSWCETYDQEFLKLSFKEMKNWLLANEHKAPKSDYARFMNNWFKRGWEQYRKNLKSEPVKTTTEDLMSFMGWQND